MLWKKFYSREYSTQYCEIAMHAIGKRAAKYLKGNDIKHPLFLPAHNNQAFYITDEEKEAFYAYLVEEFSSTPERFARFLELFHSLGETYVNFCQSCSRQDLTQLDNKELRALYTRYLELAIDYACIGPWTGFLLNDYWSKKGSLLVEDQEDKVREALFRPVRKSTVLVMQQEAAQIKGDEDAIRAFWKKYRWLPCLDVHKTPWSLSDVEEYVRDIKLGDTSGSLSFEQAVEKAGLNQEQQELFRMIKELGYIKDARDDYRRHGVYHAQVLYGEIAKRMGISRREIAYLSEKEIIGFLEGEEINLSKGKKRKIGFLMYFKDDELVCIDHNINEELVAMGFREEERTTNEVKGICASKGSAKGRVKIVRTVHDILKIEKGDILVAVTTHPDYVPAMQRAAAIVTDEGGILSHAAIVSRELKLPCIVGTGNATKVLEHGQLVEVDATNGIVKISEE